MDFGVLSITSSVAFSVEFVALQEQLWPTVWLESEDAFVDELETSVWLRYEGAEEFPGEPIDLLNAFTMSLLSSCSLSSLQVSRQSFVLLEVQLEVLFEVQFEVWLDVAFDVKFDVKLAAEGHLQDILELAELFEFASCSYPAIPSELELAEALAVMLASESEEWLAWHELLV